MGLFDRFFKPKEMNNANNMNESLTTFTTRAPIFSSFQGSIYEMELTRSIIHAKAKHTAKLSPHIEGNAYKELANTLKYKPNEFQSTYDFLYRLRTLYEVDTYAFIIPLMSDDNLSVKGFYPLKAEQVEIMEYNGVVFLKYSFLDGTKAAIEYDRVGVLSKMNYRQDFLGDGNGVLNETLSLLDVQKQGVQDAIKQSARIDFMARLGGTVRPEDIERERKNFTQANLSRDNKSGVMMFDQKYIEVKQIEHKSYIPDEKQMSYVKNNLFSYFGINEDILQNKYNEDIWNAFYEGEIEPFAVQLSLAMTNMLFTSKEKAYNNYVHFSANRLQYASNKTKLDVSQTLFDRGIFGTHEVADIWNMPKTGENKRYIRKEYAEMDRLDENITQIEIDDEIKKELEKGEEDGNN